MSRTKRNAAAEEYLRRAPNYSAEAIEDLRVVLTHCKANESRVLRWLIAGIESAHKFVLPDYGQILGPDITPAVIETADASHIPFPETVIEFGSPTRGNLSDERTPCERRLVACLEVPHDVPGAFSGGFMAWPIGFVNGHWLPQAFGFGFYYSESGKADMGMAVAPFGEHGERVSHELLAEGRSVEDFALTEYMTEVRAVYQFRAALACTNVTTEILRPNREARASRPASTLFDYHVLMIQPGAEHATSEDRGGTHASPRTHLRRGHIRRLAWGPRVWVNSCVVNPGAAGTVNKDYRVAR